MADDVKNMTEIQAAKEPTLESRITAMEQALANLGDVIGPGGKRALAVYNDWRKTINLK